MTKIIFSLILVLSSGVVSLAQEITGFSLINTVTNSFIVALENGDTISLAAYGDQLSIRADTTGTVGSVRFDLNGVANFRTEGVAPYALSGDSPTGNYQANPVVIQPGSHVLTATIFSGASGAGSAVASRTITITTAAATDPPPPPAIGGNDVPPYNHHPNGAVTGELRKWHKVTLGFDGPTTSEEATPNPFTDYRFDVTFTHDMTNSVVVVPGYFAADGNAANTGATSGNVWLVHFSPDQEGTWSWTCSFLQGPNVAQNGGGTSAGFMDGKARNFVIEATDKTGRDHRGKGRLQYVGEHHLQFQETKKWFVKAGADSPENFLAYNGFDDTPNNGGRLKDWSPHLADYRMGDPTWAGDKGQSIIGAINYLALEKGMNVFSFLPMNIAGDDKNVFPYVSSNSGEDRQRIDVSKTAQWEVVFEHADHIGLYLHFKTQETENDQLLDGGDLGLERRLYYRELVARFSHHLALNWNIGEENTNTDDQRKAFADYFKELDPYDSPVVIHTYPGEKEEVYNPLLGHPSYDGISIQTRPSSVFADTLYWVDQSNNFDRKWVVANDEQGNANVGVLPDANDPDHDEIRKNVLWANLMAGGAGVEYYFGYGFPNSDLTCNDFRSRDEMWTLSRYALDFFELHVPSFWSMTNRNDLIASESAWCLANDEIFVIYLKDGGTTTINLPDGSYSVSWFDPRNGGDLQTGSIATVSGGNNVPLGNAPNNNDMDWAVVVSISSGFCFSADSTVEILNEGTKSMKDLEIGDMVRTADGSFQLVYSFGHYAPDMLAEYYQIHLVGMEDALEISRDHMVFQDGVAVPASLLAIGDSLHVVDDESDRLAEVRDIKTVWKKGAYAPFTTSGTIAVNGIAASSYVSLQPDNHVLKLGDGMATPLSMQWLAHTFESTHRLICRFRFDSCVTEEYTSDGLSLWIARPFHLSQWILSQNAVVVVLISVPVLLVGLAIRLVENGVNIAFSWNPFG